MDEPLVVESGEYTSDELLAMLEEHGRLLVRTEVVGSPQEVTLRYDGETYYCDTPTTLHRHDDKAEMRACMQNHGYVTDANA